MEDKLPAGDFSAHQHEVQAMFCARPSILLSSQFCIPIPLWVPSLPPLDVLPPHSAPRHHHHHQPCQQLYPHQPLALPSSPLPSADLAEELVGFASRFKHWRVRLGFTQREVGLAVNCSQPKISNFENLNLSLKSMHKMKPKLENWLDCEQRRSIRAATFPPRLWSWSSDSITPIWSGRKSFRNDFCSVCQTKIHFIVENKCYLWNLQHKLTSLFKQKEFIDQIEYFKNLKIPKNIWSFWYRRMSGSSFRCRDIARKANSKNPKI